MINNSQAILCTSKTNQEEIKKMFDKECFVCRIPFSKEFPENIPVEERKKIVCISRFYPGKRTDEFFKMAKYLPEYDFVFRGAVYDKNRKPIGGLGAQIYFKKIEEITKEVNNVIFANDELSLEEVLKGALFSVDLSEQLDKDRPQYTTLEAFGAGVIPIINPSFSGRMRDGKEVLTAVSAEEAVEKIKKCKKHKEMLEFGKVYLEEYTKDTFNNFLDAYKNG